MALFIGNVLDNFAIARGTGAMMGFGWGTLAQLVDGIGDTFLGFGGNDYIVAGNGNDSIDGHEGNDHINGSGGFDSMDGGSGVDTLDMSQFSGTYMWNMATGWTSQSVGGEWAFNFENALTGDGDDDITGSAANNYFRTNGGNDRIRGAAGNDTVLAGSGADIMDGGTGIDTLDYREITSSFSINMLTGVTSISGEFAFNFERVLTWSGNDTVVGNGWNNDIATNAGRDILDGANGGDSLSGGADRDSLFGGADGDQLFGDFDRGVMSANGGDDDLYGQDGNDQLFGGDGRDLLFGGGHDDYLFGEWGNDTMSGGAGVDYFIFNTQPNSVSNTDFITDFQLGDRIILSSLIYTALSNQVSASTFRAGSAAMDSDDRVIYNAATRALFYDSDGNGGAAQVQFATVLGTPLQFSDFIVAGF